MFGCLTGWYTKYTFSVAVAPGGILRGAKFTLRPSIACSCIGNVTARHSSSRRQPNVAALYKEWSYRTFTDGATYIRLGGHHVGHRPTFLFSQRQQSSTEAGLTWPHLADYMSDLCRDALNTRQSAVTLCGRGVKAGMVHSTWMNV